MEKTTSLDHTKTTGHVDLVGAGPGDPELITLKGARLLEEADTVVYDRLVNPALLKFCRPDCDQIYVGKRKHCHSMPQARICELLVQLGNQGRHVVRLKGGDPYIFGRGGEEIEALVKAGISCSVVPGITAATGCAASTGIPLTHREHAQAVTFVTGHRKDGRIDLDWSLIARPHHTTVIYMGLSCIAEIVDGLAEHGMPSDTPVAVIARGSTPEQQEIVSTLGNITADTAKASLPSPALLIIGAVVLAKQVIALDDRKTEFQIHYPHTMIPASVPGCCQ